MLYPFTFLKKACLNSGFLLFLFTLCMAMLMHSCKGSLQGGGVVEKDSTRAAEKDSLRSSPVKTDSTDDPEIRSSYGLPSWALNPKPLKINLVILPVSQGRLFIQTYSPGNSQLPFPVVLYFPGTRGLGSHLVSPGAIARQTGSVVILVKYRLLNGHRYPVENADAFAAYLWTIKNIASFRGDAKSIAVLGESFGGNLAISVSMMARDRGYILPVHQVLVYPLVAAKSGFWNVKKYSSLWTDTRPSVNHLPLKLRGLEPATIITNDQDPLRNDVMVLAAKMRAAGIRIKTKNYDGNVIRFFGIETFDQQANTPQVYASFRLREVFRKNL